jgi:copper chaperone CopZ
MPSCCGSNNKSNVNRELVILKVEDIVDLSSATKIQKKIHELDGILDVKVNLKNDKVAIDYDINKLKYVQLEKKIQAIGYKIL